MASPSRFNKVGLQGRTGVDSNTQDTYLKTFEFPVVAVASAALQDTGIPAPTGNIQVVSAYLNVTTAEASAAVKTLTVGVVGAGAKVLGNTTTVATGPIGTPVTAAFVGGANWSYTLAGADFAELAAVCVVTVLATDV